MVAPMLASKEIPFRPLSSTRLPSMSAPALVLLSYQMPSRTIVMDEVVAERHVRRQHHLLFRAVIGDLVAVEGRIMGLKPHVAAAPIGRMVTRSAHVVVDVIVPDGEVGRELDAHTC